MKLLRSLNSKIIVLILFVIIFLSILVVIDNYYGMQLLRKQAALSNSNLLSVYMVQLDNSLDYLTNYLSSTASNDIDIYNYLNSQAGSPDRIQAEDRIINKFNTQINYLNNVNFFFLYSELDRSLLLSSSNPEVYENNLLKKKIEGVIFAVKTVGIEDWQLMEYNGSYKLVKIVDTGKGGYLGTWLSLEGLLDPLSGLELGENGGIHIITEKGFPLISTFSDRKNREIFNRNEINPGSGRYKTIRDVDSEEKFLIVSNTLENLPIYFIAMLPESEIFKNLLTFRKMIYYIPLISLFILFLYYILIKNILFKPMNRLITAMKRVSQGDLNVRLVEDSSRDFNFLFNSFNDMIDRVKRLKMNVYEEKILAQKAELRHLQSQIKPHFLFNSLNLVYNLAVLKDFESVKQMSLYLASYLRFSLKNEDKLVALEEELDHIKNYLEIQRLRFLDKFSYTINVEKDCGKYMIPSLTIQPFVENSIIHGFNKKMEHFEINIKIIKGKERLIINIVDNGKGFIEEKLGELKRKKFNRGEGEHIGIWNVYQRLNLNYGGKVDLLFSNQDSGGAVVRIIIPIMADETKED